MESKVGSGDNNALSVTYYTSVSVALFNGPGGFTHVRMGLEEAAAIATVWGATLRITT